MLPWRELDADKFLSEIVVVLAVGHSAAGMVGKYLVTIKIFACDLLLLSTVSMLTENWLGKSGKVCGGWIVVLQVAASYEVLIAFFNSII